MYMRKRISVQIIEVGWNEVLQTFHIKAIITGKCIAILEVND